jgi:hypothetical protein
MNPSHFDPFGGRYGYLDNIRIKDSADRCRAVFAQACKSDPHKAVAWLNDRRLTFPCLFILLPQVRSLRLHRHLNARNATAAGIVWQILGPRDNAGRADLLSKKKDAVYPVLKWMLETGRTEEACDSPCEQVLDVVVSTLLDVYSDKSILPAVCDMIFRRSKKGRNIHDLAWALFRPQDPNALKLVAEHLRSHELEEAGLACNLLHLEDAGPAENQKQYQDYLRWLKENDPFLYFTGESLQFSSRPTPCRVDQERKYMQKRLGSHSPQPLVPSDNDEADCLAAFAPLDDEHKAILSEYSYKIRSQGLPQWKQWIHSPIDEQIRAARAGLGEVQWL